jgi:hypothetical protein
MSSISDRNRRLLIERLQGDPRLGGAEVRAATALMRISIVVTVVVGILGAIFAQVIFGEGGIQFAVGMAIGYGAYFGYLAATMKEPRVIGAMAALTDKKVLLLGSRKAGIVAEWKVSELENVEMIRTGNLFMMGKIAIAPKSGETLTFFTSNRRLAVDFVDRYREISSGGSKSK